MKTLEFSVSSEFSEGMRREPRPEGKHTNFKRKPEWQPTLVETKSSGKSPGERSGAQRRLIEIRFVIVVGWKFWLKHSAVRAAQKIFTLSLDPNSLDFSGVEPL